MEDQYGMADLRQYMNERPMFPSIPPPPDILASHHGLTAAQHYEMMHPGLHQEFHSDSNTNLTATTTTSSVGFTGFEMEAGGLAGDGGTGRWPRQETLTLLEIRSRLDSKFKEANQKGPLWDEVSRIMSEEYGFQRSGKKCREKFENLYKYYKKTKEGKAGRQDGKHYRFFRQLEALYGESSHGVSASEQPHIVGSSFQYNTANNSNIAAPNQEPYQYSLSLSNSSDFDTTSSEESDVNLPMENDSTGKRKKRSKRNWKAKIKEFIDSQMRKLMEKQDAWLEKMMKTIEKKEQERMIKEEAWRKQELDRVEHEHKLWAKEREWIGARDTAIMEALGKLTGTELKPSPSSLNTNLNDNLSERWLECEITRLIQFRTTMEEGFHHGTMWEEIASKMASLGYEKTALMCKEKWDSINDYLTKCHDTISNQEGSFCDHSVSNANCSTSNTVQDGGSFRYLMGDGENLWDSYGLKLSKGDNI